MGRGEQVGGQDEGTEGVVGGGGEDRGAVCGPLGALEVVALILGEGWLGAFGLRGWAVVEELFFFGGCFGYAALVEVSCGAYESWIGRVVFVREGRHRSRSRPTLMEIFVSRSPHPEPS